MRRSTRRCSRRTRSRAYKGELKLSYDDGKVDIAKVAATGRSKHRFNLADEKDRVDLRQLCERAAAEPGENLVNIKYAEREGGHMQPLHVHIEEPGWVPPDHGFLSFEYVTIPTPFTRHIVLQLTHITHRAMLLKIREAALI